MTQVRPTPSREPVEPVKRRYLSRQEKLLRWIECGKVCANCGESVAWEGPNVIWDHRLALFYRHKHANALSNFYPLHTKGCNTTKTATDKKEIAHVKRIIAREEGTRKPRKAIPGKPFPKSTRKLQSRNTFK